MDATAVVEEDQSSPSDSAKAINIVLIVLIFIIIAVSSMISFVVTRSNENIDQKKAVTDYMKNKPKKTVIIDDPESIDHEEVANGRIQIQPYVNIPPNRQSSANFDSEPESDHNGGGDGGNSRIQSNINKKSGQINIIQSPSTVKND